MASLSDDMQLIFPFSLRHLIKISKISLAHIEFPVENKLDLFQSSKIACAHLHLNQYSRYVVD